MTMAEDSICHFLAIPREVRNVIYEHLTHHVDITPLLRTENGVVLQHPVVKLDDTIIPSVLCINKQVHDEYIQHVRSRAKMEMVFRRSLSFGPFEFADGVTSEVLKNVKRCDLVMSWERAIGVLGSEEQKAWLDYAQRPLLLDQPTNTPSKELCKKTRSFLISLRQLLHPQAHFRLLVELDRYPLDLSDPWSMRWSECRSKKAYERKVNNVALLFRSFLDISTLRTLEDNPESSSPDTSKISVCFLLHTPLYSGSAKNAAELRENQFAYQQGLVDTAIMPDREDSEEMVEWLLEPSDEHVTYCGFRPSFVCLSRYVRQT